MPKPKFIKGVRVPASYLNFYIANKIVLVPIFNDQNDKVVLKIFKNISKIERLFQLIVQYLFGDLEQFIV